MTNSSLHVVGRKGEWFIRDDWGRMEDAGPYTTREEAEDDRRGLERFRAEWDGKRAATKPKDGMLF